jgi:exosortase A
LTGRITPRRKLEDIAADTRAIVPTCGAVLLSLFALGFLFWHDAIGAVDVWIVSPTFNHCFLIIPLCFFLIWTRRNQIADLEPRPDYRALIFIVPLTVAWLVLSIMSVLELEQFLVLTIVQCMIFGMLGGEYYRRLLGPFLYLYFLVPSGAILIPALQAFTAKFAVAGLHVLGIPVFSNGAIIDIPAGTFAVAEACAGLRFLIASVAFGVFFSFLTYRSFARRAIFIALSIVIPVIANGFRALGLIAAAQWVGSANAVMADHLIYGWVFFSAVLVLLIFVGQRFSDEEVRSPARLRHAKAVVRLPNKAVVAIFGLSLVLAALGPALQAALRPAAKGTELTALPPVNPPWMRDLAGRQTWTPLVTGAAQAFQDRWQADGLYFDRYVAVYGLPGQDRALARSSNRDADEKVWTFNSAKMTALAFDGRSIPVRASTWYHGPLKRVVWSYFEIGGQASQGGIGAKMGQLKAYFAKTPCRSAYIAVSATGDTSDAQAVAFLDANRPLMVNLCRLKDPIR